VVTCERVLDVRDGCDDFETLCVDEGGLLFSLAVVANFTRLGEKTLACEVFVVPRLDFCCDETSVGILF